MIGTVYMGEAKNGFITGVFSPQSMQQEMAEQEHQLAITREQYNELQGQLHHMLNTIAKEAGQIGKLEAELREGKYWKLVGRES